MMAVPLTQDLLVGLLESIQGESIEAFLTLAPRFTNRLDRVSHLLQETLHLGRPGFLLLPFDRSKIPPEV